MPLIRGLVTMGKLLPRSPVSGQVQDLGYAPTLETGDLIGGLLETRDLSRGVATPLDKAQLEEYLLSGQTHDTVVDT